MTRKLSNKEWEEYINQYYSNDSAMTVNEFCRENSLFYLMKLKNILIQKLRNLH